MENNYQSAFSQSHCSFELFFHKVDDANGRRQSVAFNMLKFGFGRPQAIRKDCITLRIHFVPLIHYLQTIWCVRNAHAQAQVPL